MYEESLSCVTVEAGQDLSASQFCFVSIAGDGQVDPTGAGAVADGVLQNDPNAAGVAAAVAIAGVSRVVCGGVVSRGALVASDASGRAIAATTGAEIAGRALAAGTTGALIPVLLKLSGRAPAV
jgi:hypothetical protein